MAGEASVAARVGLTDNSRGAGGAEGRCCRQGRLDKGFQGPRLR